MTPAQKTLLAAAIALIIILAAPGFTKAEVPPDIAKQLVAIGRGVCVPETAQVYRPLHPNPPYKDVAIVRDISFGPDPKDVAGFTTFMERYQRGLVIERAAVDGLR